MTIRIWGKGFRKLDVKPLCEFTFTVSNLVPVSLVEIGVGKRMQRRTRMRWRSAFGEKVSKTGGETAMWIYFYCFEFVSGFVGSNRGGEKNAEKNPYEMTIRIGGKGFRKLDVKPLCEFTFTVSNLVPVSLVEIGVGKRMQRRTRMRW